MLNPWRLQLLVDLQELGTVRAVAGRAHLSPSAVSQQLAVLERETGAALVEREGRRVRLTPAGQLLADRSRDVLHRLEQLSAGTGDAPSGTVRLAVFQSAVHALAVPAAEAVAAAHPAVEVVVLELEPHESMPALRRGDVDVIVTTTDLAGTELGPAVDLLPLGTDEVVAVLPPGHPAAAAERLDLAACAGERWTLDVPGSYMSELTTRRCRDAGFEPHVVCRLQNYLLALQHVAAGRSVALLPSLAVDARSDVVTRPLDPPSVRRVVAAVRRPSAAQPAVRAVLDQLRTTAGVGLRHR
ncbi:LysR family transcriptional regulator [Klenkia taihuensis]|uniref:DNA-binding transcriptional regulator, LysR family n=1 Tax=Klenkia taihuensis TaxID=1225127 RepID=A0A1I1QUP3_9ACTN|nr:LysR family transcriptional regulator [Klenkia taihuensis]GHE07449.1 LysR family transcriptional regulator [Klenkia taihuensis]SFD25755.1 DNA-binding transcriptional regulator, LysR family [Klenkia taihuensis]